MAAKGAAKGKERKTCGECAYYSFIAPGYGACMNPKSPRAYKPFKMITPVVLRITPACEYFSERKEGKLIPIEDGKVYCPLLKRKVKPERKCVNCGYFVELWPGKVECCYKP